MELDFVMVGCAKEDLGVKLEVGVDAKTDSAFGLLPSSLWIVGLEENGLLHRMLSVRVGTLEPVGTRLGELLTGGVCPDG